MTSAQPRGGLFESLFGTNSIFTSNSGPGDVLQSSTYRTICVRTCGSYYYPVSVLGEPSQVRGRRQDLRHAPRPPRSRLRASQSRRGRQPGALDTTQQPYTSLPNAFKYRTAFDNSCSCRAPGETWANALRQADDTIQQGDVVVTDDRARQLSLPRFDAQGKPIRPEPKAARPTAPAPAPAAAAPAATPAPDNEPSKPDPNRKVRAVGPTFIPPR